MSGLCGAVRILLLLKIRGMAASASTATTTFDVHRCRFVDYVPAAITAIAVPPAPPPRVRSTQKAAPPPSTNVTSRFPPIAVGRGDGNIELYEWSGVGQTAQASPQAWILHKVGLPSSSRNLLYLTPARFCTPPPHPRSTLSFGPYETRHRYAQAKRQLWPTCVFSAPVAETSSSSGISILARSP